MGNVLFNKEIAVDSLVEGNKQNILVLPTSPLLPVMFSFFCNEVSCPAKLLL